MKYIILGHENPDVDSLVSGYILEKVMKKRGYDVSFCIPDKAIASDSEKICNKYNLYLGKYYVDELPSDAKYILVDHHERKLDGEIVCIIDHHPTSKRFDLEHYYMYRFTENLITTLKFLKKDMVVSLREDELILDASPLTEEQLEKADLELKKIGYLGNDSDNKTSVVLLEFCLKDVPGSVTNVLELINQFNFNISYINSQENGTDYQYFKMGLYVEDVDKISEFLTEAEKLCKVRVIDYNSSEKIYDNSIFF